ncbi:sugar transferase [Pectinatus frisingensis]|uniref:sugar transferase n=1 Tax=Pectinatus frisingensis TaxID=865 RepID=UPI001E3D2521|nr:sugar transferase [Pectinatus frisingensis]
MPRFSVLRKLILLSGDILGVILSVYLSVHFVLLFKEVPFTTDIYYRFMPMNIITIGIFFNLYRLYSLKQKTYNEIFLGIGLSIIYSFIIMMAFSFYFREFSYSRSVLVMTGILEFVVLNIWQYFFWRLEMLLTTPRKVLLIGRHDEIDRVKGRMYSIPNLKYKIVKTIDDTSKYETYLQSIIDVDLVIICAGLSLQQKSRIMESCQQMQKQVLLWPSIYELFCRALAINKIDDIPFFSPQYINPSLEQRSLKRVLDIILAGVALIALIPLMAVTAMLIKLDSRGPVFYKQLRVGRYGKNFFVYKFRSMRTDAEKTCGPVMAGEDDPRITHVGRFLRRTRIDEVPQFINVLKGSMSIVGPRPERPFFVEKFKKEIPEYIYRYNVKPGITGMAQVYGKYNTTVYDKLIYDLMYIQHCDVFTDFTIMIQTVRVLFQKSSTEGVVNNNTEKDSCA